MASDQISPEESSTNAPANMKFPAISCRPLAKLPKDRGSGGVANSRAEGPSVVHRAITRSITPGTVTGLGMLSDILPVSAP
ncbi:hypothetical protein NBRC116586_04020 [Pseudooceanicola nitratireducens]